MCNRDVVATLGIADNRSEFVWWLFLLLCLKLKLPLRSKNRGVDGNICGYEAGYCCGCAVPEEAWHICGCDANRRSVAITFIAANSSP